MQTKWSIDHVSKHNLRYIYNTEGEIIGALGPTKITTSHRSDWGAMIHTITIPMYKVNELGQLILATKEDK